MNDGRVKVTGKPSKYFSLTVSGVNVTWRRIRARSDPESLISESDLDEFVLVAESEPLRR